jgi:Domain of unknown function (DUF4387)
MTELWQLTRLIRSKNAGPFEITFDIMFKDEGGLRKALAGGTISPEVIAKLYRVESREVRFFVLEDLLTVKISIPRKIFPETLRTPTSTDASSTGPSWTSPCLTDWRPRKKKQAALAACFSAGEDLPVHLDAKLNLPRRRGGGR